jgi:hypothetical protein
MNSMIVRMTEWAARKRRRVALSASAAVLSLTVAGAPVQAQTPAATPSARLRALLPADVAERVIAQIEAARARELPAQALENRALKFAVRGVAPAEVERAVREHAERQGAAQSALAQARRERPSVAEVEAGAEAMRMGVDGAAISALAKSAPSGRSLAVPLEVLGSLMDRGLPSDEAIARVRERLLAKASDAEMQRMRPEGTATGKPDLTGRDLAATRRSPNANPRGGPPAGTPGAGNAPAGVPRNGGVDKAPKKGPPSAAPGKPTTPKPTPVRKP